MPANIITVNRIEYTLPDSRMPLLKRILNQYGYRKDTELSKEDRNECTHIRTHKNGICQICGGATPNLPKEEKEIEKLTTCNGVVWLSNRRKINELIDAINKLKKEVNK